MARTFEAKDAKRERVPVLVALCGPSGSGKTYSALCLAEGIQRVAPGPIFVLDSEAKRALHYADIFSFKHVPFGAPFSPMDYLDAITYCVEQGATTIVIDSMSHEHEGPGGVLEMHDAQVKKLSGGDAAKAERVKMLAWSEPKQARRRLINSIIGMPVNFILCFRAKEKLKVQPGKPPENIGYQPIAGEDFVYEMTSKLLLLPGADGVPTMESNFPAEQAMIKVPQQFRSIFPVQNPPQLSRDVGEQLARWASSGMPAASTGAGAKTSTVDVAEYISAYEECKSADTFGGLEKQRLSIWKSLSRADQVELRAAVDACQKRIESAGKPSSQSQQGKPVDDRESLDRRVPAGRGE